MRTAGKALLPLGLLIGMAGMATGALTVVDVANYRTVHLPAREFADVRALDVRGIGDVVITAGPGSGGEGAVARVSFVETGGRTLASSSASVDASGTLRARQNCPVSIISNGSLTCGGRIQITVPEQLDVAIRTSGGSVRVKGKVGDLSIRSGGGDVAVDSAAGTVKIDAGFGRINVTDATGAVTAHSGLGDVTVTGIRGDVTATSESGRVIANGSGDVVATSDLGDVTVIAWSSAPVALTIETDLGRASTKAPTDPTARTKVTVRSGSGNVAYAAPAAAGR